MEGYHLCEPSRQRTPLLFQAGSSARGRSRAARHAECIFIGGRNHKVAAGVVADLRECVRAAGRDPAGVRIYTAIGIIAADTDAAAQAKVEEYRRYVSTEGSLALLSGYWHRLCEEGSGHASRRAGDQRDPRFGGHVPAYRPEPQWTLREAAAHVAAASPFGGNDLLEAYRGFCRLAIGCRGSRRVYSSGSRPAVQRLRTSR